MVNRVILIGNLGRDPEVRRLENGAVVTKFSVATNESYRDKSGEWQEQTEWHDVVVWRALAERAASTLKKGATIYVEGKLTHRSWQDQDGNNRRTTEVVGSYFRIIKRDDNRFSAGGNGNTVEEEAPVSSYGTFNPEQASPQEMSGTADDDLPF